MRHRLAWQPSGDHIRTPPVETINGTHVADTRRGRVADSKHRQRVPVDLRICDDGTGDAFVESANTGSKRNNVHTSNSRG